MKEWTSQSEIVFSRALDGVHRNLVGERLEDYRLRKARLELAEIIRRKNEGNNT